MPEAIKVTDDTGASAVSRRRIIWVAQRTMPRLIAFSTTSRSVIPIMATRWCLFSLLGPGHHPGSTSSTLCPAEMAAMAVTRALLFPGARRQLWDFTERCLVGGPMGRVRFFPLARERAGPLSPDPTRRTGVTGTRHGRWRRRCTPPTAHPH